MKKTMPNNRLTLDVLLHVRLTCLLLAILYFTTDCKAQSFYRSQQNLSQDTSSKAMSPEEYKSMMQSLEKQNRPAPTPAPVMPPPVSGPAAVPSMPAESVSTPPAVTPASPPPAQPITTPAAAPVNITPSSPPAGSSGAAPAKPPENQPYTGFVNPSESKDQGSSGTDKSTGWNIQY